MHRSAGPRCKSRWRALRRGVSVLQSAASLHLSGTTESAQVTVALYPGSTSTSTMLVVTIIVSNGMFVLRVTLGDHARILARAVTDSDTVAA
eukprot:339128-Rhodomonas_salina.2